MNRLLTQFALVLAITLLITSSGLQAQVNPFTGQKSDAGSQPTSPADMNTKAQALIQQKKYDEAVLLLKQSIAVQPKNIQAYALLGIAYQQAKHFDLAVESFLTLVKLSPNNALFQNSLGGALLDYGKPVEARAAYERAVEMDPGDAASRFGIGACYMRQKDYQDCYRAYVMALGYAPDSPDVHNALGDALEQLNQHEDSLAEYEAAGRLSPADAAPIIGRATALCGLKRFAEAETLMRALVAKSPKDAVSHTGLAQALDAAGKHEAAISEYKVALTITPDDAYLWGNLGWAYYNAGKYDDSLSASRKALAIDKTLAYVRFNIGLSSAVQNKDEEAGKEYDAAIAVAAAADIHAGISDLREAMKKHASPLIQRLITKLSSAEWKALGLSVDLKVR